MRGDPIQQSDLWDISRRLVAFNTVSSLSNVEAVAYLADLLEDAGFSVQVVKEAVQGVEKAMLLAWAGPAVPDGLILSGHIDVVPFDGQPGWTSDPLAMCTDGERIFGRGVTDMKVFLAQAILAARRHPPRTLKRPLMFMLTCDEELAGQGAGRLVKLLPDLNLPFPLPSVALIGEPTNFSVFSAHKGYAIFDIRVRGKGGHSSAPASGLNAIEKMSDVIQLIREYNHLLAKLASPENKRLFPASPSSVFNCGVISGGLAANMIAEVCQLTTSLRVAPGDQADALIQSLRERLEDAIVKPMRAIASDSGVWFENLVTTPPLHSPTSDAFCDLLCRIMHTHADTGAPYATDGGQFQQIGINSYICGPGLLEEAHQPNESLPVEHFFSGLDKLSEIINACCVDV